MLAPKKLKDYARENGLTYHTVWRWNKKGSLPENVEVRRMPSGSLMLYEETEEPKETEPTAAIYASINHREERSGIEHQVMVPRLARISKDY